MLAYFSVNCFDTKHVINYEKLLTASHVARQFLWRRFWRFQMVTSKGFKFTEVVIFCSFKLFWFRFWGSKSRIRGSVGAFQAFLRKRTKTIENKPRVFINLELNHNPNEKITKKKMYWVIWKITRWATPPWPPQPQHHLISSVYQSLTGTG